jgi:hypothetical protein
MAISFRISSKQVYPGRSYYFKNERETHVLKQSHMWVYIYFFSIGFDDNKIEQKHLMLR